MQAGTNSEMKVSTRLALGFGALVVLMVIIGGSAWLAMNSITHRLSQIRWADLIIVLRKGRVAAIGRHEELMASSEAYARIFQE